MFDRVAICDAYYMFASLYHGGQGSKEYAIFGRLDKLKYKPGAGASSQRPSRLSEEAREVFDRLVYDHEAPERARREALRDKVQKRINRIMAAAENEAKKTNCWQLQTFVDDTQFHYNGYAEPGYTDPDCGIIATSNWNEITKYVDSTRILVTDTPARIAKLFEKLGIEIEWHDEWCSCSHCGKLMRTQPDSWSWTPSYTLGEGELWCHECKKPEKSNETND